MNAKELIEKMNIYTLSSVRIYDLATSAHKLQWPINSDKPPRLKIDLPKSEDPIAVDASAEFEMTVGLLYFQGEDGMTMLPHENKLIPIERIIATQIMLYNYCLLEEYEFDQYERILQDKIIDTSNDKYTLKDFVTRGIDALRDDIIKRERASYERKGIEKRVTEWEKPIRQPQQKVLEKYRELSNRRNELTHQSEPKPPTLREAVEYFYYARYIGIEIGKCFHDPSVAEIDVPTLENLEIGNEYWTKRS